MRRCCLRPRPFWAHLCCCARSDLFLVLGALSLLALWLSLRHLFVPPQSLLLHSHVISSSLNYSNAEDVRDAHLALAFGTNWARLRALDCARLVAGDGAHVEWERSHRIVQNADPSLLDTSCAAIRARWHFPDGAPHSAEQQFPLAIARTVFRDYLFLEQQLSVEFAPQNVYCFSLDAKASKLFRRRMHALASCFPQNVLIARREFNVSSDGKGVSGAHLACLEQMLQWRRREWKYALLLQNHDIPLRTNAEFVRILRVYNGTNDVATRKIMPISVNRSLDWTLRSLHLYRDPRRLAAAEKAGLVRLHHTKSLNLVALSRAAVEFTLRELDLAGLVERLERSKYGMDEVLFSTLNSNLADFPGGFTRHCLERHNRSVPSMGRYTIWRNAGTVRGRCQSDHFRHDVCVYGVEDLAHIASARLHFHLNKMMPNFDFGAMYCWLGALAARRNAQREGRQPVNVNTRYYGQLAHVRYNRLKAEGRLDRFDC